MSGRQASSQPLGREAGDPRIAGTQERPVDEAARPEGAKERARPAGDAPATRFERSGAASTSPGSLTARCTPDGVYTRVSYFARYVLGIDREALVGRPVRAFVHPDDVAGLEAAFAEARSTPTHVTVVYRHRALAGSYVWLESVVFAVREASTRRVQRLFVSSRDVTARVQVEQELQQVQQVLRIASDNTPEGLGVTDLAGRFTMVNSVLVRLTGYSEDELLALRLPQLVHADDRAEHHRCVKRMIAAPGSTGDVDERLVTRSGAEVPVRLVMGVARDDRGRPRQLVVQVSDVRRFKERELELERQANLDPLTGVGNRRLLEDRLRRALSDRREPGGQVGLMVADLDGFKEVNDRHGHAAGDSVLVGVARRIAGGLRSQDTVARIGGDEFVVVCPGLRDAVEAEHVLGRLRRVFREPVVADDSEAQASASVGMVLSRPGDTVESLLHRADLEMYQAKARRSNPL